MELIRDDAIVLTGSAEKLSTLLRRILFWTMVTFTVILLSACSGNSFTTTATAESGEGDAGTAPGCEEGDTSAACTVTAAYILAVTDKVSIKSDGFDTAVITATVLDENRAAVENVQVLFSSIGGKVSSAVGVTDENGNATVNFTAAPDNPSNGTIFVIAEVENVGTYTLPIEVTGSGVEISTEDGKTTIVTSVSATKEIIVKATNSAGLGVYGASVAFTLYGDENLTTAAPAGTTISPNPATTDIRGEATVTITGSSSGDLFVQASALGATDVEQFFIQDATAFRISSPTPASDVDYVELTADGSTQVVTVAAGSNNVPDGSTIRFATTVGSWTTGSNPGGTYTDVTFNAGTASATLQSNTGDNGFSTVYAFVVSDDKHNDSLTVAMSPPVADAAQITVQTESKTLLPSTSTTTYSTKVRTKVFTDNASGNYPVANVPVVLQIQNATGGGETISQSYGFTDVYGFFETKFNSGVTSTGQVGVRIVATVAGTAVTGSATVEIGGTPGSVAIGTPREIVEDDENLSINTYVMSALVADGTGAAVAGANVTLHVWPTEYYTGFWVKSINPVTGDDEYGTFITGTWQNEDVDEDGILDPGEDVNQDGELNPAASYAGTIPATVTTDSKGAAPFNYVYLKDAAPWVNVRATGATKVFGTEAATTMNFVPTVLKREVDEGRVNNSPFKLWLLVDDDDATGTAISPGTTTAWAAFETIVALDKGTIDGAGTGIELPAASGPYVAGDTESILVTTQSGYQFDVYIRFID